MKTGTVHFHHVRNVGRGHKDNYTLAIFPKKYAIYVGISKCSRKDQFEKAKGRVIAEGRAKKAAELDNVDNVEKTQYVDWSIVIPRADYALEGEKIKREVVAIALSEIRVINSHLSANS